MKSTILLIFLVQTLVYNAMAVNLEEKKENILNTAIACQKEAGAAQSDLQELMSQELPSTKPGKCMRRCIFEKLELLKENKIDVEAINAWIKDLIGSDPKLSELAQQIAGECVTVTDPDGCELIGKVLTCMFNSAKTHGIDPKKLI